jgi:hypothetical protein
MLGLIDPGAYQFLAMVAGVILFIGVPLSVEPRF